MLDELVNGAVTKTYTYGLQRISENQLSGSTWTPTFYGYDGHGNVRFTTSTAGAVGNTYQFDAFGAPIASTGTIANTYLYSGERFDTNLNLYHLRARYYNMLTGRFETMDPWQRKGCSLSRLYSPSDLNAYAYADADPVDKFDPTGRAAALEYEVDLTPLVKAAAAIYIFAKVLDCAAQLAECTEDCQSELDAGGEWPFRRCIADCMLKHGCNSMGPYFRSFFQIRSLGAVPQPCIQLQRHRCEELSLVHPISQMVTIGAAAGVFWRPNLNCRHSLTDGVYDLLGNTLGLFRAGASLFESGVEIRKRLVFRGGRLAAGIWRTRASLPLTLFRCCHGIMVAEAGGSAKDRNASDFRLGSILRPTLESLRPFSIGLRFTLPHYNWYLEKIVSVVPLRAVQCALITVSRDVN